MIVDNGILLARSYTGSDINRIGKDIEDVIRRSGIPFGRNSARNGSFKVTIEWESDPYHQVLGDRS